MLPKLIILCFFSLALANNASAQEKWGLLRCIQYAMDSNISVQQSQVQESIAGVNYRQSRLSKYPNANFSNNDGSRFGKSQNPSTGVLETRNYFIIGLNFQSSVDIFNWYSKRNTILADEWEVQAAKASTDKLKNDIALTVANAYLQILLAKAQLQIAQVQLTQSIVQFDNITKQVKAGALPELNAVELEAQVARDSANLISAQGNVDQTKYVLKAYMNIDAGRTFEIEEPSADQIPVENIADLQPDYVYAMALKNLPQQRMDEYKINAAQKRALAARGALFPTISAYATLGTNYGYFKVPTYNRVLTGYDTTLFKVTSGGYILQPLFENGSRNGYVYADPLGTQLKNNFGQTIGINISVPIFNGWSAKGNLARAKLNARTLELQRELDNKTIKQDIYQAYNSALVAMKKFTSSLKSVDAAQRGYDFASKRFNIGMLTTLELTTNQNNLLRAKLDYVLNQFDYVFKMKVLEFYKGEGLKL